jgi:hypothetical protein
MGYTSLLPKVIKRAGARGNGNPLIDGNGSMLPGKMRFFRSLQNRLADNPVVPKLTVSIGKLSALFMVYSGLS